MNHRSIEALVLLGFWLLLISSCTAEDKVISVNDDDAEMTIAISKARETLPHFWQVFDKRSRSESGFALKIKISDKKGVEHFWVIDLVRQAGKTMGTINNDPDTVGIVKLGDRIEIPEPDITDWLYMREGKMVGNFTLKPLFKQMPPEEVKKFKIMMTDP